MSITTWLQDIFRELVRKDSGTTYLQTQKTVWDSSQPLQVQTGSIANPGAAAYHTVDFYFQRSVRIFSATVANATATGAQAAMLSIYPNGTGTTKELYCSPVRTYVVGVSLYGIQLIENCPPIEVTGGSTVRFNVLMLAASNAQVRIAYREDA